MSDISDLDYYPFLVDEDGTATCWNCRGEGYRGCHACGGDAFLDADKVAVYCAEAREDAEAYVASVEAIRARRAALPPAEGEEPF